MNHDGRSSARPTRRVPLRAGWLLCCLLLVSCSWIPTSGTPQKGRDLGLDTGDSALRIIGQEPVPGASPVDVVSGFLQASADFDEEHAVARRYLTPRAGEQWNASTGTVVYDRNAGGFSVRAVGPSSVRVSAAEVGRIDSVGHYARSPAGTRLERTFEVQRTKGTWRISGLEDGLVLNEGVVPVTYRQVNLYFLASSRDVLVPDPVFLPALPGLSSTLVTRLLRGPTEPLRGAVTTAFPTGTDLEVSAVPVIEGIAHVNLGAAALGADEESRRQMSAQLVWTLKQLGEVQGVRLSINGEALALASYGEDQPADAWPGYDPAGLTGRSVPFVVRAGRLGQVVDQKFVPLEGAAAASPGVRSPAVSTDYSQVAAVTADGRTLVRGRLGGSGETLTPAVRGADLAPPSWGPRGDLWTVDRVTGRVWTVPGGDQQPLAVGLPDLGSARVIGLQVSRDGGRVALTVAQAAQTRLLVAVVLREPDSAAVRLAAPREPLPGLRDVRDVAWADATNLAVLGALDGAGSGPLLMDISGYVASTIDPLPDLVTITAAPPGRPILVGTATGRLLQYTSGSGWVALGEGGDPAYPG